MATPDYLNYILNNPGLRESAEAMGYTQQEMIDMGDWHWNTYGQAEFEEGGRLNTPFETQIPTERTAQPNPTDIANFEASVRRGDPSEMWTARSDIGDTSGTPWDLGQFSGEGWNFDPDNPYGRGILADTIAVDAPVGQLMDTGDSRFLQDRYLDPSIAQDFPVGWTTPQNTWAGPEQLGGYWDAISTAERNAAGELVSTIDRPAAGWAGPSVAPGTRGGGNVRAGGTNISTTGPPNPTVPSFGYPGYQDWTRFMPTDFQLAEGGGRHYQTGVMPGLLGGGGPTQWAGPNASYPNWNDAAGGYANDVAIISGGGTTGVPPVTYIPPGMETGTTPGGNVTTDTSGNQWVMTPGGQWVPAGSDYANALSGTGPYSSSLDPNFYDQSGAFVGSEGGSRRSIMSTPGTGGAYSMSYVDDLSPVPGSYFGTKWQDTIFANPIATHWGINLADQRTDAEKASQAAGVVEPTAETGYESDWSGL